MEIVKDRKFLRKKSKKVEKITDEIRHLVLEMEKTMENNKGMGIAAPQVDHLKRIIVIKNNEQSFYFINPVILEKSRNKNTLEEGCLSLPDCCLPVKRPEAIKVKFLTLKGEEKKMNLSGIPARIFQHEIDHLNGILITDRISWIQKIKNKFIK